MTDEILYGEDGAEFGDDKRAACWRGWYMYCVRCRERMRRERFMALEVASWNDATPVCLFEGDTIFFDDDELADYCEENNVKPRDLMLVQCVPVPYRPLDVDYFDDCLPDGDDGSDLYPLIDEFNAKLAALGTASWRPGNKRVEVPGGSVDYFYE